MFQSPKFTCQSIKEFIVEISGIIQLIETGQVSRRRIVRERSCFVQFEEQDKIVSHTN